MARRAATHEGATVTSSQALDRLLQSSNYDRDFKAARVRAGLREIDVVDVNDQELGRPQLQKFHAAARDLYTKLANITDEQNSLVKSTWRAMSKEKKTEILRKSWYVLDSIGIHLYFSPHNKQIIRIGVLILFFSSLLR